VGPWGRKMSTLPEKGKVSQNIVCELHNYMATKPKKKKKNLFFDWAFQT